MIEKCLALSTCHVPPSAFRSSEALDTGALRSSDHCYGWVVFVYEGCPKIPKWIKPIHDYAVKEQVSVILFDRDANRYEELFKSYDW